MGPGDQACVSKTCNVLDVLLYSLSTTEAPAVGAGGKCVKMKALRWQENGILKLVFADTVLNKGAILLIF